MKKFKIVIKGIGDGKSTHISKLKINGENDSVINALAYTVCEIAIDSELSCEKLKKGISAFYKDIDIEKGKIKNEK